MPAKISHHRSVCIASFVCVCLFVILAPSLMAQGNGRTDGHGDSIGLVPLWRLPWSRQPV
jgi:hypothetical protein